MGVDTPVYRGHVTPRSVAGRMAASVGWLREVLVPGVVLKQVLQSHPDDAVRLSYHAGSASVVFSSGTPQSGAQSTTVGLHDGWTVKSFGPAADAAVFADGHALALLIAGSLLSVLLGAAGFRPRRRSRAGAGAGAEGPPSCPTKTSTTP